MPVKNVPNYENAKFHLFLGKKVFNLHILSGHPVKLWSGIYIKIVKMLLLLFILLSTLWPTSKLRLQFEMWVCPSVINRGGFLKNNASPSGLGHWFRYLGSIKNIIKTSVFMYLLTFDIYAKTYELNKIFQIKI